MVCNLLLNLPGEFSTSDCVFLWCSWSYMVPFYSIYLAGESPLSYLVKFSNAFTVAALLPSPNSSARITLCSGGVECFLPWLWISFSCLFSCLVIFYGKLETVVDVCWFFLVLAGSYLTRLKLQTLFSLHLGNSWYLCSVLSSI